MRMTGSTSSQKNLWLYLHNAGYNSCGGNLSTGIQQRTAKAAGPAFVDGGQFKVGVLVDRMYAKAPTGKSKQDLDVAREVTPFHCVTKDIEVGGPLGSVSKGSVEYRTCSGHGWRSTDNCPI